MNLMNENIVRTEHSQYNVIFWLGSHLRNHQYDYPNNGTSFIREFFKITNPTFKSICYQVVKATYHNERSVGP